MTNPYDDEFFDQLLADHDAGKIGKRKTYGKKLHGEMMQALRGIDGCQFVRSWDDAQIPATLRPADIQACLPPHGLSVLIECKETRSDSIAFSRIDDHKFSKSAKPKNNQRRSLLLHSLSGGLSLIAVQRVWPNRSRTWLIPFQLWEQLRRELGRESIPLDDARRPTFTEVGLSRSFEFYQRVIFERERSLAIPLIDYRYE